MSTAPSHKPVVECIGLTKVFQDFWGRAKIRAVDNLDLDIRPGEVFGLLGPNGSGKSTTIKILLGLLYPTSGVARVFDRPPTDIAVKARIGFLPEESYLYRYLNAHETLDYYGRLFKLDRFDRKRRTSQLIDMVGLQRAARRPVGTYSKGMARRIGLAQALINDPDFLILDEPTTGLDPIGTRQIKDVIRVLADRGKTVLLSSHLLADVEDVCDRVAIMYGGKRQALGTKDELLERRDITQLTTKQLDEKTIANVRKVIQDSGNEVIAVDHPTVRLEELFLQVVGKAQRNKLETSGAQATTGVSEFLGGKGETLHGEGLIESLVDAGARDESKPVMGAASAPDAKPKEEIVQRLTQVTPKGPEKGQASAPLSIEKKPSQDVLDRLMKPKSSQEPKK